MKKQRESNRQKQQGINTYSKSWWQRLRFIDALYIVFAVIAASALISMMRVSYGNYVAVRTRLAKSKVQLAQLQKREKALSQRLAYLNSPAGRDQLLRERGLVHGKERILLFTNNPSKGTVAVPAANSSRKKSSFWGNVFGAIDHAADRR